MISKDSTDKLSALFAQHEPLVQKAKRRIFTSCAIMVSAFLVTVAQFVIVHRINPFLPVIFFASGTFMSIMIKRDMKRMREEAQAMNDILDAELARIVVARLYDGKDLVSNVDVFTANTGASANAISDASEPQCPFRR